MRITLLLALLLVFGNSFGQRSDTEMQKNLDEIREIETQKDLERQKRVEKYAEENGLEIWNYDSDKTIMLRDIDKNGNPIFISTLNSGAAVTSGADFLNSNVGLGLNLTGEGVKIGVWDGGLVRSSHVEFDRQVITSDGATTLNFHATHVTGTITANGVNERAKGMAPDATVFTQDWNSDLTEMTNLAKPDQSGILLSNHSYGPGLGWINGSWNGDRSISIVEDWRFGFYDSEVARVDAIALNAPYYLMAWAAGNDRDDAGDGSFPPDGPYDIILGNGSSKNSITVGAVNKIRGGYENPEDVVMSGFSSWGPTDDGRIKPDIVGAGVSITSTFESSNDAYGTISGTSMATPNVVGTLALLQELNKNMHGNYLKSSALKGLAIHTAHEAGRGDGPDYQFGWGLMNGKDAGLHIIRKNSSNRVLENFILKDGEQFSFNINPVEGAKVKVTICWIDLPGTPTSPQLDPSELMLVNDLDLRIKNEIEEYLPYILDPSNPSRPAVTGDNFRDNVEKIEFVAGSSDGYVVTINHKGSLQTGSQEFSLVVSYESDDRRTFYKLAGGGPWNDGESWSYSSGGVAAMAVPGPNDLVIFDNNTFPDTGSSSQTETYAYSLDNDVELGGLIVSSQGELIFNLEGNTLTTNGGLALINGSINFTGEGSIVMKESTAGTYLINGSENSFKNINLIVDYEFGGTAIINENLNLGSLVLRNGAIAINETDLSVEELKIENSASLSLKKSNLTIEGEYSMQGSSTLTAEESSIMLKNGSFLDVNGATIPSTVEILEGTINLSSDATINKLKLLAGSVLSFKDQSNLTIMEDISEQTILDLPAEITSNGRAKITYLLNQLVCLNNVNVSNVDVIGDGAFNVGVNGTIMNAEGWQAVTCEEVVFSNFSSKQVCENSVEKFTNESNGQNLSSKWFLDGELLSEEESAILQFPELKEYEVTLEVTNESLVTDSYTTNIIVRPNSVPENEILLSGNQLVSRTPSDTYQWFKDNELMEGETGRTLNIVGEEGVFFVVTTDATCSRKSPEFEFRVTSADEDLFDTEYILYPNPASELLSINIQSGYSGAVKISMTELSGREIYSKSFEKNGFQLEESINTSGLPNGLYVLTIAQGQSRESKLVVIEQ